MYVHILYLHDAFYLAPLLLTGRAGVAALLATGVSAAAFG